MNQPVLLPRITKWWKLLCYTTQLILAPLVNTCTEVHELRRKIWRFTFILIETLKLFLEIIGVIAHAIMLSKYEYSSNPYLK